MESTEYEILEDDTLDTFDDYSNDVNEVETNVSPDIDALKEQLIESIMYLRHDKEFMDELNELTFVYCSYKRKRG